MVEKRLMPTVEEMERFEEHCRIFVLADEFMLPKPVKDGMGAVLVEAFDRPEDFWRVARMLRKRIVRRNVVVSQRWAENVSEVE